MSDVRKIEIRDDDEIEIRQIRGVEIKEEMIELKTVDFNRKTLLHMFRKEYEYQYVIKSDKPVFAQTSIIYIGKKGITTLDNAAIYISQYAKWEHVFRLSKALSKYKAARIIAENYDAVDLDISDVSILDTRVILFHYDVIYLVDSIYTLIWIPGFPHHIYYDATSGTLVRDIDISNVLMSALTVNTEIYENLYDAIEDEMARRIMFDDNKRLVLDIDLIA